MDQTLPDLSGGSAYEDDDLFGDDNTDDFLFGAQDETLLQEDVARELPTADAHQQAASPATPAGQDDMDNPELRALLNEGMEGEAAGIDINNLNEMELSFEGEKADDAVNYEDISDDDLAEEDAAIVGGPVQPAHPAFLSGIEESAAEPDLDDLFGGDDDQEPSLAPPAHDDGKSDAQQRDDADSVISDNAGAGTLAALGQRDEDMTEEEQRQYRLQQLLFAGEDLNKAQEGATNKDNWLHDYFPAYDREDESPFWNKLLPPKPGKWPSKQSELKTFKKPRPIRPTKVTLDIESDQMTHFTLPAAVAPPVERRSDLVHVVAEHHGERLETLSESGSEDDLPNGLSMQEIEFMCTNFDTLSHADSDELVPFEEPRVVGQDVDMSDHDHSFDTFEHPIKKRRLGLNAKDIVAIHQVELPSLDDPEKMTARLAREVILDLNDPRLLVEEIDPESLRQRTMPGRETATTTSIKDRLAHRFKTSNDAAYNLLQQNQKKVRGQLSHMTIDHSVPAIRLQYPYYQVKLAPKELRNWHRRQIHFKSGFAFNKINKQKRKDFKNKQVREAFAKTRDISVADNSYVLLLEYSEEHPVMLSQTGMGNKVVNYYRKVDSSDTARPKSEIGDTSVLMPEDKSPFNNFGHIDPGESTLALYNSMYRAPIFKQAQKPTDFLVVREITGLNGQLHYLRNIDYQYIVGQELPSVTVPGTHSRNVTTASKNRLKAISFRIARRKKSHRIRVEEVTRHFPDTNDMQNRQKMKEFMAFNKEHKEWEMRDGAPIPDEDDIQKTLRPEDICLLESMQVGAQYLHDSGYAEDDNDDDDAEKEDKADLAIEQQLAPWKTTKNFIQATQGKAMLRLYGEGDPSGRGEAFSFIKTSMKGGFKAQGLSVNENVGKGRSDTATGGHTYNVAKQQKMYDESIRDIWNKQKAVLSSEIEPEDIDDEGVDGQIDQAERARARATPASGFQTPSGRRRDDETGTSFSKRSGASQAQKFLKIERKVWNPREEEYEYKEVIESDPQVIKLYVKRKEQLESHMTTTNLADLVPTGDPEVDARNRKMLEAELARLEQTKQKRPRKKKTVNIGDAASPSGNAASPGADGDASTPAPVSGGKNTQATQRKCANCGRVGHIKTNKKLCPLLNGEISADAPGQFDNAAFIGAPSLS